MRIGIDSSRATVGERTGTENYSLRLVRELIDVGNGNEFVLYFREPPTPGTFPDYPSVTQQVISFPRLWTHVRLSWEMLTSSPDVLFVPAHVLPILHPARTVVTIHDLGYLYHRYAHRTVDWCYLHLSTLYNARMATKVIADSNATKRDLIEKYDIAAEKITTVYLAHDDTFRPIEEKAVIDAALRRYHIEDDYFFCLGTMQPRKNLMGTVAAYATMKRLHGVRHKLVIAGKHGWLSESIFKKARSLDIEDDVVFTGYVPDEDLPALLTGATALVFISLYEGFGLPALEAMACGTPVIASNVSSLPEVVGDAGLLVDPQDVIAVSSAMTRLATDSSFRNELSGRGIERAHLFSWRQSAAATLDVIRQAAN
ncbi:MAG: glycosyltransferase family 4 protein [Chloroflexi bacterium]|nr:glycosyltransferase family 4 protein [Chloroflexota bacterium]